MNKASNINLLDRMALQRSAKVDDGFFMIILRGYFDKAETPPQYIYKNLRNSDCFYAFNSSASKHRAILSVGFYRHWFSAIPF